MRKLLIIEDRFLITDRGLVLLPGLRVPTIDFKGFQGEVEVRSPTGKCSRYGASFNLEHHLYSASEGRGEWKVMVTLKTKAKSEIEIGSELFVDDKYWITLTGKELE